MTFQGNPEALPFLLAAAVSAALAAVAWRRRAMPLARPFAAMMLGEAVWSLFEALELAIVDLPVKVFCFGIRAVGAVTAILGMLAFVLRYTGHGHWLRPRRFALVCAWPVGLTLLALSNPWHHLFWERIASRQFGGFWVAVPSYAAGFWMQIAYCYAAVVVSVVLLGQAVARSAGLYRAQAALMLFGVMVPWVVNIVDMSRLFGFIHVDTAAMTFTMTGLAFLPGLFRLRLLDVVPVARAAVVQGMSDPVIVLDPQGRIVDLNLAAQRLTDRAPREALGARAAVAFGHWPELAERLECIESLSATTTELRRVDDGSESTFDVCVSRLDRNDGPAGWVVVLRDISAHKRAEEQRVRLIEEQAARAKAEAANRAKDEFLAVLSHELRTPLTPVLAAVTDLLDEPATPAEIVPMLTLIRRSVMLEARLIDDLLDITRISRGKLRLSREVADAHELIKQAVEVCGADIRSGNLMLDLDLAAHEHHIEVDPARFQQVVWNLVKNAVKFTPAGGRLTVRTSNREAEDAVGSPALVIEVSDTGIGIAPEVLPRIFDAFEQGDLATTGRFGGLGLGLAISRSLVEAHAGQLTAASAGKDQGATFTIEMAAVRAPQAQDLPQPASAPLVFGRPLKILLVEDHADTRWVISKLLRNCGFVVSAAGDVHSALALAEAEEFDLLITDLGLPDGSGLGLMRTLRARGEPLVPGIAMTGYGADDDIRRSEEAGFADHLTKPIDFRQLEASIRQIRLSAPVRN